jgi:glycosyltransferase involved in cell wall biosynthesis
LTER